MVEDETFLNGEHTTKYLDEHIDRSRFEEAQEKWGTGEGESGGEGEETVEHELTVEVNGKRFQVNLEGSTSALAAGGAQGGDGGGRPSGGSGSGGGSGGGQQVTADGETVNAEMQGTILQVNVGEGNTVESGDVICVLEAMKMENDVIAERGGAVSQGPSRRASRSTRGTCWSS